MNQFINQCEDNYLMHASLLGIQLILGYIVSIRNFFWSSRKFNVDVLQRLSQKSSETQLVKVHCPNLPARTFNRLPRLLRYRTHLNCYWSFKIFMSLAQQFHWFLEMRQHFAFSQCSKRYDFLRIQAPCVYIILNLIQV